MTSKTVDLVQAFWDQIAQAAKESPWVDQDNYTMNDVVSDVCSFLREPDMAAKIEKQDKLIAELLEALEAIATGRDKDGMKVDFPQDIARAAIAKATE